MLHLSRNPVVLSKPQDDYMTTNCTDRRLINVTLHGSGEKRSRANLEFMVHCGKEEEEEVG